MGQGSGIIDTVGNRTSQTAPGGTTLYSYDGNNRLIQAGGVSYSYDANGNLSSTSAGQSFRWDAFNRLTQASGSGGTVSYRYNGDGLKVRRSGPDGVTVYYYDGIRPIWETTGAGALKARLDRDIFGNLLSRREANGTRRYFAHDGLGGLTALTDSAGAPLASLFYDAWGNLRSSSGTWNGGNYRFTGAELDQATGLYHMGARFYAPSLGRWLSEDPMTDKPFEPQSLNFYAYVANNPLLYVDPAGTTPDLAALNQRRQEIVKGLLAAAKDGVVKIADYVKAILDELERSATPETGARVTAWIAGITGTLAVGALAFGRPDVAVALGGASMVFTAASMLFTEAQYRQGQISSTQRNFSLAWSGASIIVGGAGIPARSLTNFKFFEEGAYAAATIIARTLGWGGISLPYYRGRR
ncbi:MAG: RHS repeat-associated core domain-containing protein [Armatimonadota bacterium]|nr:RHS repeat-associated core domain-containing protein [Armatimonadota bacterium]MDR7467436.1 RHS repeat-associated core domain-containing protein [Armatimonadota bacterium]MDR7494310.1 RHS repeat-associated core domain-containing protein [Armatimonadota bacterium]MDR7504854.1 RHS repeat-associated core domain-containing protein [Armatimonadota bacterium]MDR7547256.1 RHS repeat-associated core domain-containing protein [Armatimonadota bacterium]